MNPDPKRWNPFKFFRLSGRKPDAQSPDNTNAGDSGQRNSLPDLMKLLSREQWRAVEDFFLDPTLARGVLDRWFGDFSSARFQPRIDVVDEGPVLRVTVELPGIDRSDVKVSVVDGVIIIRGEKKQDIRDEENGCYRLERSHGRFERTVPMPEYADPERALARYDNGILTLTVPKCEPLRSSGRQVEIEIG
ncbi:MAG: Hsp20/alpha crystallin family protein [Paraburkholderia tropica]|uniref:Heat shock protein Hsp20 n=1 Tax=Paraburkholderia tropica TaxID=92647 RepID=A0ABX5MK73_9BURK|nr:Hsp20/alpha crystallin family protein [Paraburkholderia tropica]PXX07943.1 heat shock protein Hsp20 [Paraburkholderia tropica]PZW73363.1 heat shock protein Hsp20 [Paraburkholderia tropica]QNB17534.1 Hsp20/alpha crystallin family protein [Paraburkholderia tropica]